MEFRATVANKPLLFRGAGRKGGGAGGIRTLDTVLPYTHFPGERLRPLGHRSALLLESGHVERRGARGNLAAWAPEILCRRDAPLRTAADRRRDRGDCASGARIAS